MREYWILTRLQGSSLFGLNKIIKGRDGEEKKKGRRSLWVLIAMVFCLGSTSFSYSVLMAGGLAAAGQLPALLSVMAFAASALVLMFSIFETKAVLYGQGENDTTLSWPVPLSAVVGSRLTTMYGYNLVYALLLLVPAGIVYGRQVGASLDFYLPALAMALFLPVVPTAIGALIGTVFTGLAARMKKKNLFNTVGQLIFIVVLMVFMVRLNGGMEDDGALSGKVLSLDGRLRSIWPLAFWFRRGLTGEPLFIGALAGVSALGAALAVLVLTRFYFPIHGWLAAHPRAEAFRMGTQKRSGMLSALYRREWRMYLGSPSYVVNTAFGYVLLLLAAVVLCFVRPQEVMEMLSAPELKNLRYGLAMILAWMQGMSQTTACSVSIEGKRLWIVKSLPVPARMWLESKLLLSLTMAVPCGLLFGAMIAAGMGATPGEWAAILLVPTAYGVFFSVFGLWVNLKLPKLDWQNENEAVKQSASVMVIVFSSMAVAGVPLLMTMILAAPWIPFAAAGAALLAALLLWLKMGKTAEALLYRL